MLLSTRLSLFLLIVLMFSSCAYTVCAFVCAEVSSLCFALVGARQESVVIVVYVTLMRSSCQGQPGTPTASHLRDYGRERALPLYHTKQTERIRLVGF